MSHARNEYDDNDAEFPRKYNTIQKLGQAGLQLISTAAVSEAAGFNWNFPWNVASAAFDYALIGEAVRVGYELTQKDYLWLRQLGSGEVYKGVVKEVVSGLFGLGVLGGITYGMVYLNGMYVAEWQVSDNKVLETIANLVSEPSTYKPLIGSASYIIYRLAKFGGAKALECCSPSDEQKIMEYPKLNLLQIAGDYTLNIGRAISLTLAVLAYLKYAEKNKIADNVHYQILLGVGSQLFDNVVTRLFYKVAPLNTLIPKDRRFAHRIDDLYFHEEYEVDLHEPGCGSVAIEVGFKTMYQLFLAGLAIGLYETIKALDDSKLYSNDSQAGVALRLFVAMGAVGLFDYLVSHLIPAARTGVVGLFRQKSQVDEVTPINERKRIVMEI